MTDSRFDRPLRLQPLYRERIWGGTRLRRELHRVDAPEHTAESWELADLPDASSVTVTEPWRGKTLSELVALDRGAMLGKTEGTTIPLLVKLIDAGQDLSVQLHPSDETARKELGERGKTEMWYVLDAAPGASLFCGLTRPVTREEFRRRAEDGSITEILRRVEVKKGDVFFIAPGTVHALGAGLFVAEVQQSSDSTFRLYDYGRLGADGKPRELHIDRAVDCAVLTASDPDVPTENGNASFLRVADSPYFTVDRLTVRGKEILPRAETFRHLLCVEGEGTLFRGNITENLRPGDSFFLPAGMGEAALCGDCRVLLSAVPNT